MNHQLVGYCAGPAIFCSFASNAPWMVTVVTGILGGIWYGIQIYKAFTQKDEDDEDKPS